VLLLKARKYLIAHGHQRRRRGASEGNANYIQQNNNRKFPKSRERYSHTDARGLQNTKQTRSK
jgi:hypothetical protein